MKKTLSLIFIPLCLFSCTNVVDKKIVLTEYRETIEEIKKGNYGYTEADYIKANKLLDKLAFKSMSHGTANTEKTYKQLLDEAKEGNKKDSLEVSNYNGEIQKMKSAMSVIVNKSEYIDAYSPILQSQYRTFISEIEFKNLSGKAITGIEGKILVKNNVGSIIKTSYIKLADSNLLAAGKTQRDTREYPILDEYDNIVELKANSPETFKYEWKPELIIFDDGSRMKAPDIPFCLLNE